MAASRGVDVGPLLLPGTILLALVGVVTQLDAVANTYANMSPISVFELLLAGLVALAVIVSVNQGPRQALLPIGHASGLQLIAALMCWIVVCLMFSTFFGPGLSYTIRVCAVMLLPLLMACLVRDPRSIAIVLGGIVVAGLANGVVTIYEGYAGTRLFATSLAATRADFDGVIRSSGTSDLNPTSASQMLMVSVLLAAGLLASGFRRFWPVLLVVIGVGSVAIGFTAARSTMIALGIGFGLIMLRYYRHFLFPLIVPLGLAAAAGAFFLLPESTIDRFAAILNFGADRSLFRRLTYISIGWDLLWQSPIWGVGPGNFQFHYMDASYRFLPGRTLDPRELHNTYFDVMVEYGLVGFALFAGIVTLALKGAIGAASDAADPLLRQVSYATVIALVALLIGSFFMPHKDFRYLWLLIGIALQCAAIARFRRRHA